MQTRCDATFTTEEAFKLRYQKRTYLGLGAAAVVPVIFAVALHFRHDRHGGDFAFSSYLSRSGLAVPLVLLFVRAVVASAVSTALWRPVNEIDWVPLQLFA